MRSYDVETGAFGLADLAEESDQADELRSPQKVNESASPVIPKNSEQ